MPTSSNKHEQGKVKRNRQGNQPSAPLFWALALVVLSKPDRASLSPTAGSKPDSGNVVEYVHHIQSCKEETQHDARTRTLRRHNQFTADFPTFNLHPTRLLYREEQQAVFSYPRHVATVQGRATEAVFVVHDIPLNSGDNHGHHVRVLNRAPSRADGEANPTSASRSPTYNATTLHPVLEQ